MFNQPLVDLFRGSNLVSLQSAEEIAAIFTPKNIKKDEFLLKEGRVSNDYYFLENGFIRSFAHDPGGEEVTTGFYGSNSLVFEVFSFFNRVPSKENFQATTECTGWHINFEQLNGLFHSRQEFREFGRSILVKGYSALKSRMLSMITETAEQRYEALLLHNPLVFQYAQLKHIASYLGITDTSLSRIRKTFAKK